MAAPRPAMIIGRYPIIILYAIALHVIWAVGLYVDPNAAGATTPSLVAQVLGSSTIAAAASMIVALLAAVGLFEPKRVRAVCFMLPQQFMLMLSALSAGKSIILGEFADGVQRGHWFIAVDQAPAILAVIGHTAAILIIAGARE